MFGRNRTSAQIIKKYTVYLGTLFSDVWLKRFDTSGDMIQESRVPINYGPREKFLARVDGNPDLERPIAIQLPRMSFELKDFYYDPSRKVNPLNRIVASDPNDPTGVRYQYQPIPYNFVYELSIMVKNYEDGIYILEQILPSFQPTWQASLRLDPSIDQTFDVPITLNNTSHSDTYEGQFVERRAIVWTLTFTINGFLFQPTQTANTGIIKTIDLNFFNVNRSVDINYANTTNSGLAETVNVTPGQFANGQATSHSIPLWTYSISNVVGSFEPTEIVRSVTTGDFAYIASANGSQITTRNVHDSFANGANIVGENNNSATIISILRTPEAPINYNLVQPDSEYGFITDLTSYV